MNSEDNPILIAGLGAIGSILYARLVKHGFKVVCLTSKRGCKLIREKNLIVKLVSEQTPQLYQCEVYEKLPSTYKFQYCIVSTKSWYNPLLANYLKDFLREDSSILLFQNGLDIEQPFRELLPSISIIRAVSSIAATREDLNHINEKAVGITKIGPVSPPTKKTMIEFWNSLLTTIKLDSHISSNIHKDIWKKAIVNCAINPLGAITGLPNGKIITDSFLKRLVSKIVDEVVSVIPPEYLITKKDALVEVISIAEITSSNKCSMLQDLTRGLQTEINYLNGAIIERAKKLGLDLPINQKLVKIIKNLESKTLAPELAVLELRSINR